MLRFVLFSLIFSFTVQGQILFSEYAEGSSYNKYIEIYNYSNETINLDDYILKSFTNGSSTFENLFPVGAFIEPGGLYVVASSQADESILSQADYTFQYCCGNGDDAYALMPISSLEQDFNSDSAIDIIGYPNTWQEGLGWDAAGVEQATKNHTMVRKSNIYYGNYGNWPMSAGTSPDDSEWLVLEQDDWSNLGFHEYDGGVEIVFGCTDSFALNYNPLANADDGSCEYAELFGCADSTACNYDPSASSSIFSFSNTDSNMTIAIEVSVGLSINLEIGDVFGVFYTNDLNELTCAGSAVWNNEALAIAAWGSESGLDNGFVPSEEFTFIVKKIDGSMFLLDSSMNSMPPFSSTYEPNGFGQVLSFSIVSQYFDLENCDYPEEYYDCFGNCLNDADGDGVCDEFELDLFENSMSNNYIINNIDLLGRDVSVDQNKNNILIQLFNNGNVIKKVIIK